MRAGSPERGGRYPIFLLPLVFGSFIALIIGNTWFLLGFIAFHLFFLLDHIIVWRRSDPEFDKQVYAAIEASNASAKSEIRATLIAIPVGAVVIFLAIVTYHHLAS